MLVAVLIALAIILAPTDDSPGPSPSGSDAVVAVESELHALARPHARAVRLLRGMQADFASFESLRAAGARLDDALQSARASAGAPDGEIGALFAVALDKHASFAAALEDLPDISEFDDAAAQQVIAAAEDASAAYDEVAASAPNLGQAVDGLSWRVDQLLAVSADVSELRDFVGKVDNILEQSSGGRSELQSALAKTLDNCSINPTTAALNINSVVRNRQSVLNQISSTDPPSSPAAQDAYDSLQQALQFSIEADRHFQDWLYYVAKYYYQPPRGCLGQPPPQNRDYNLGKAASSEASAAKSAFVSTYNPLAEAFGFRTWSAEEI